MAEYFPLISRAVAGLRTGTPEARKAIYDRARQALVGQLRAMDPPVPEDAIARETAALDEAIARAEAEIVPVEAGSAKAQEARSQPPSETPGDGAVSAPKPKPGAAAPGPSPRAAAAKPDLPRLPSRPSNTRPPAPGVEAEPRPARPGRDAALPDPAAPAPVPARGKPTGIALPIVTALKVEPNDTTPFADIDSPKLSASRDDLPSGQDEPTLAISRSLQDEKGRDEAARPAAPRPVEKRRPDLRVWIVAVAALAAVVVIAFAAWRLRDNPQELARAAAPAKGTDAAVGKIVERADGTASPAETDRSTVVVASDQATQAATEIATAPPATGTTSAPTAPAGSAPGASTGTAADAAAASLAAADAAIPVAYKAAILVDAPDLPEKVKTYVGTVVWRTENVTQGQGQPIGTAIEADIAVPDAKLQLMMKIRRNTEPQFPASHTLDLNFTVAADSPLGSVKQINVPQMRQQELPTGDALAGIPVTIADNNFLVGLMRGGAEDRNLELLRSRSWFDVPMLLAGGKASKITFEKGPAGDRVFAAVLDSWKNAQN